MRLRGQGSVTKHGDRYRARLPHALGRKSLGIFDTPQDAQAILDEALRQIVEAPFSLEMTLDEWALEAFKLREAGDHKKRTCVRDRTRWATYVKGSLLGKTPVREVSELDVRRWLDSRTKKDGTRLAPTSLRNALSLVRSVLELAKERGLLEQNPAKEVRLSAPARRKLQAHDKWTWLTQEEIDRLLRCEAIPLRARAVFAVAIYTGLRAGELWGLRWQDIDLARQIVHVRHSYEDTPKTHQLREVPLLEPARAWLALWRQVFEGAGVRSRLGLIWPAQDERWHADGYDADWPKWKLEAGIKRRVRFHDLRHTCASHLVQGTWAPKRPPLVYWIERPLRLEEVKLWLGHENITTTQRYSHLCADGVRSLVVAGHDRDTIIKPPARIELASTVYETVPAAPDLRAIEGGSTGVSHDVSRLRALALRYARALHSGDPRRDACGADLMEAVLLWSEQQASQEGAA